MDALTDLDPDGCYRALRAKDARFDGVFFVAVTTTGIYCRPICPARAAGRDWCLFFRTAALAERDGFRACFRCRPELAPGTAQTDARSRLVARAVGRIEGGALDEAGVDALARDLGVTARHLRRAVTEELGVAPLELAVSRRLALAKQLLHDSSMPITEVALASGFASLRRFNAAFRARFQCAPSSIRRGATAEGRTDVVTLTLGYRAPFDWAGLLGFLGPRAIAGVERVAGDAYVRTVRVGERVGWIRAAPRAARDALRVEVAVSVEGGLMPVVSRVRRLFDLDAHPIVIAEHLARDPALRPLVRAHPGLRVPGAFDPFELVARAVLGQQISVAAASTLASRLASMLGEPIRTPHPELTTLFPRASDVARAPESTLASIGLPRARARTLGAVARAVAEGAVRLDTRDDPDEAIRALVAIPGVGTWTAEYVVMRALGAPDAFPNGDLGLRRALDDASPSVARARAEAWRPWRAYAALHLWTSLAGAPARARAPRNPHALGDAR